MSKELGIENPVKKGEPQDFHILSELQKRFWFIRVQHGFSKSKLAEALGISLSYVKNLEKGTSQPQEHVFSSLEERFDLKREIFSDGFSNEEASQLMSQVSKALLDNKMDNLDNLISKLKRAPLQIEQQFHAQLLLATYYYKMARYEEALEVEESFVNVFIQNFLSKELPLELRKDYYLYLIQKADYLGHYAQGEGLCQELLLLLESERQIVVLKLKNFYFYLKQEKIEEAYELRSELKDKQLLHADNYLLSFFYFYIVGIQVQSKFYNSALKTLKKIEEIATLLNNQEHLAIVYQNRGSIQYELKNYREAYNNHQKALSILPEKSPKGPLFRSLIVNAIKLNKLKEAKIYIKRVQTITTTLEEEMMIKYLKAEVSLYESEFLLFEELIKDAIAYYTSRSDKGKLYYIYTFMATYYNREKNHKLASHYFMKREELEDEK